MIIRRLMRDIEKQRSLFLTGKGYGSDSGILREKNQMSKRRTKTAYRKFFNEGCEKYNACHHVCPAGIDIARLMAHSDAAVTAAEMNDKKVSNAE